MARYLALEWDTQLARLAVAELVGGRVVLEKGITIPFPTVAEGDPPTTNAGRLDLLAQKIIELGWNKLDATISIGRTLLEIRTLQAPPVPDEELPDLVRFQAARSFSSLTDDWPVDFIPLADASDGSKILLAAALPANVLADVRRLSDKAGLRLVHVVCRPFAAAELLPETFADNKYRLLVDVLGSEADLTVISGRNVVFPRSVRLVPDEDPATLSRSLVAEIRRTMVAARNQLGGGAAEEIVLLGNEGQQRTLYKALVDEFKGSLSVTLFDPLAAPGISTKSSESIQESTSVFAPLVGVLHSQATGRAPTIDFLNPRRRPIPISYRPLLIKAGIAAAALFLIFAGYLYWSLSTLDQEIASLNVTLKNKQSLAEKGKPVLTSTEKVDEFANQDVVLLDELLALSMKFPPANEARLEELSVTTGTPGTPITAAIQGGAASDQVLSKIEQTLRDSRHTVYGNRAEKKSSIPGFAWSFSAELHISPDDPPVSAEVVKAATSTTPAKGESKETKAPTEPSTSKAKPAADTKATSTTGGKS